MDSVKRFELVMEEVAEYKVSKLGTSESVYKFAVDFLKLDKRPQEHFGVFCIGANNDVNAYCEIGIGSLTECISEPRDIIRHAIMNMAQGVILIHNHPSGDPKPSDIDIRFTQRIQECTKLFNIALVDHVIVGQGRYESLRGLGYIE